MTNEYVLNKNDFSKYKDLFFYSFKDLPTESKLSFLKNEFEKSHVLGIKEDNQLVASVTCIPFKVNFFGKTFTMSGIGNVMSAPEYIPNNGITQLMQRAFTYMYQKNIVLSYLGPFSYDYYRRFGYEQVFENLKITVPFEKFKKYPKPKSNYLKRFKYSDARQIIDDVFKKTNTHGTIIRSIWWWDNLSLWSPGDLLAVSYNDKKVTGYLRYEFTKDEFIIHDFLYKTTDSLFALMHFVNKHRSIYRKVIIKSSNINLRADLFITNPIDAVTEIQPFMMSRIVLLQEFMENYPVQSDDFETIRIKVDDFLEWNNHIWELSSDSGKIEFKKEESIEPDMVMDIQTLTKGLFGYQSLNASYLMGDILGNPEKIKELDSLLIKIKPELKDEF